MKKKKELLVEKKKMKADWRELREKSAMNVIALQMSCFVFAADWFLCHTNFQNQKLSDSHACKLLCVQPVILYSSHIYLLHWRLRSLCRARLQRFMQSRNASYKQYKPFKFKTRSSRSHFVVQNF